MFVVLYEDHFRHCPKQVFLELSRCSGTQVLKCRRFDELDDVFQRLSPDEAVFVHGFPWGNSDEISQIDALAKANALPVVDVGDIVWMMPRESDGVWVDQSLENTIALQIARRMRAVRRDYH